MPSILIAYPIDHSSIILADKLRSDVDNKVTFFIDRRIDNDFMTKAVHDVQAMSDTPISTNDTQDWRDYDYVVFPNLNIFPGYSDKQHAETINKLFRIHLSDIMWKDDVTVILGQNFRGLIAANEIGKAYGEGGVRTLPDKDGNFFVAGSLDPEARVKVAFMRGSWSLGQFSLAEGITLYENLTVHIENGGNLEMCEIVGKHPSDVEAGTYDIMRDAPVFMSVKSDPYLTDEYTNYLKKCNNYFRNDYS